jgi:hypothetical protein
MIGIMKHSQRSVVLLMLAAALTSACDETAVQDIAAPVDASSAQIKFFNFGVGSPAVNFYANDTKMTAILSATGQEATTGVIYGGVASGGYYGLITPGQYTLSGRIAAATDKDLAISTLPATLAPGKFYSFYQSGIYNTATKTAESFIVEDPFIPTFDYSVAYVRFVHAISNANPMTLYGQSRTEGSVEVAMGGLVSYKSAGEFVAVEPGVYDLRTRYAGTATNAIARAGVSFVGGRVYTIGARGNITVASTILLDNTANR